MADDMLVDFHAVRAKSPKFAAAADRLDAAFAALQNVRDAEGACWGADESGAAFEAEYTTAVGEADKGREFLTTELNATKDALDLSADQWESDDLVSADNLKSIGKAL
ncbi:MULTISPECIES: hypothetical protein [Actinoalloteichus]|uniref:WXG100 family type VII secretion target n=1 Tax=Actinoalloteichus fjordicus TaxID=1612552 RepID=A0AAC9L8L0_9PSEU|nr:MULTISPECIES: hypothetical protein [Actinoalloteichus]APU13168.1 hypothetical protein UA74_05460 [Actinoalloteichus fjordicus]APU19118.1 hypothetical protein UA75_05460 [Actinoalloteichus sp. GBA129-24]